MDANSQLDQKIRTIKVALFRHQDRMVRKAWRRADIYREERAVAALADRLEQLSEIRERISRR